MSALGQIQDGQSAVSQGDSGWLHTLRRPDRDAAGAAMLTAISALAAN